MSYPTTCDDCANLTKAEYKVIRGGGFEGASACLLNSLRETSVPDGRSSSIGVRCARPPS
jgi:formylglycine-generating enzyme required for sulfatase activity